MEYSDKARVFLTRHGMEPERVDMEDVAAAFLSEAALGLAGRGGSLKMIPTYLTASGELPLDRPVAVIDAGGTNFRTGLVTFTQSGPVIERLSVKAMPGASGTVTWEALMDFTAREVAPLLEEAAGVGFCFSYPTAETPERDGRLISLTKQVRVEGFEDRLICADLKAALKKLGAPERETVLLNDTPAVLLSGASLLRSGQFDGLAGLISGTGTNTCCDLPVSAIRKLSGSFSGNMLVNLESGAFDRLPRGEIDEEMDAATTDPGTYRHEKMTSGVYDGELCRLLLRRAALDGLFTESGRKTVLSLAALSAPEADALASGSCQSPFTDEGDAALARELCRAIFDRAARCVCAVLSGILTLCDIGGSGKPACICVDGSLFGKSRVYRPALEGYMESFTARKLGRHSCFRTFDNATMLGSAAAALLNI